MSQVTFGGGHQSSRLPLKSDRNQRHTASMTTLPSQVHVDNRADVANQIVNLRTINRATIISGPVDLVKTVTLEGVQKSSLLKKRQVFSRPGDQQQPQLEVVAEVIGDPVGREAPKVDQIDLDSSDDFKREEEVQDKSNVFKTPTIPRRAPSTSTFLKVVEPSPITMKGGHPLSAIDENDSLHDLKEFKAPKRYLNSNDKSKESSGDRGSDHLQFSLNPLDHLGSYHNRKVSLSAHVTRPKAIIAAARPQSGSKRTTPRNQVASDNSTSVKTQQSQHHQKPAIKPLSTLRNSNASRQLSFSKPVQQLKVKTDKVINPTLKHMKTKIVAPSNVIMEQKGKEDASDSGKSFELLQLSTTSDDENFKEMLKQNKIKAQKAQDVEMSLLKRSCMNLMNMIKDQSEMAKLVQFKKFFPKVYQKAAQDMTGAGGAKISVAPQTSQRLATTGLQRAKSLITIDHQSQKSKHSRGSGAISSASLHHQDGGHSDRHMQKKASIQVKLRSKNSLQPAAKLTQRNKTLNQKKQDENLKSHSAEKPITRARTKLVHSNQAKSALLRQNRLALNGMFDPSYRNVSKSMAVATRSSQDMMAVGRREYLFSHPVIDSEIQRRLGTIESKRQGTSAGRLMPNKQTMFQRKEILDRLETRFKDNEGSLMLARGVVEHIFAVASQKMHSRQAKEKFEKVNIEQLKSYLIDNLLTSDKTQRMETAFSLYIYLSRGKILLRPQARSTSHQRGGDLSNVTRFHRRHTLRVGDLSSTSQLQRRQSLTSSITSAETNLRREPTRKQRGIIRETSKDCDTIWSQTTMLRRSVILKPNQLIESSAVSKGRRNAKIELGAQIASALSREKTRDQSVNSKRARLLATLTRKGSAISGDFDLESTLAAMNAAEGSQEQPDLALTDADLFKIFGTPSMSFLSNDCAELVRLMSLYGKSQDTANKKSTSCEASSPLLHTGQTMGSESVFQVSQDLGVASTVAQNESCKPTSRAGGGGDLSKQFKLDQQKAQEAQQLKLAEKRIKKTYDRSFMPKSHKQDLHRTLIKLKRNKSEVGRITEEKTGKKQAPELDYDLLGHDFTPYKLRLIEKSQKMKHDTFYLQNILHRPGDSASGPKKRAKSSDLTARRAGKNDSSAIENISQAIQNKAVLQKYRNMNSACSLYSLVDRNPEPFMDDDSGSSDNETAEKRQMRQKLLKKVSCPLKYEVKTKVIFEKSKSVANKSVIVKRPFIKLVKVPTNFQNPWERTAQIGPDGTFKFKQGLERLLLTKKEQKNFTEKVRINTRLKEFRAKAYYDIDGASRKLNTALMMQDFKEQAEMRSFEGLPEIIIVAIYLVYGGQILNLFIKEVLQSDEMFQVEEWPKVMEKDPDYYLLCHKQIKIEDENLLQDQGHLIPRTVIRRDYSLPIVTQTFRKNALQHANFFHFFMNQSISYNKLRDPVTGLFPKYKVPDDLLMKVDPVFSQLCDPYTSYNEGQYGITLVQFTTQSDLLFGQQSAYFGERVFQYLLAEQRRTIVALQGGENRFRKVQTPRDYIAYQAWLDFCFNCFRKDIVLPFDKREVELMMLDRHNMFSIDQEDINRFEQGVKDLVRNRQTYRMHGSERLLYRNLEILASILQAEIKKKTQMATKVIEEAAQNNESGITTTFLDDVPKLYKTKYIQLVDAYFGQTQSPLLDLIAHNININQNCLQTRSGI